MWSVSHCVFPPSLPTPHVFPLNLVGLGHKFFENSINWWSGFLLALLVKHPHGERPALIVTSHQKFEL